MRLKTLLTGLAASIGAASAAFAQDLQIIGQPHNGKVGFQPGVTEVARDIHWLDGMVLVIITAISVFVMALLLIVVIRYNSRTNPTPARFTHNTPVEVAWTVIPIIVLVFIGAFSLPALFKQQEIPDGEVVVKATGHQWYWSYEYPDNGNFTFDAYLVPEEDLKEGQLRLLTTDNPLVLPVQTNIRVLVAGGDVIHNFAMPSMGIKLDAVPGRVNETWMRINEEGTYYGQCSELCGTGHAYMPIMIKAVSKEDFDAWVEKAKEEFAQVDPPAAAPAKTRLATPAGEPTVSDPASDVRLAAAAADAVPAR